LPYLATISFFTSGVNAISCISFYLATMVAGLPHGNSFSRWTCQRLPAGLWIEEIEAIPRSIPAHVGNLSPFVQGVDQDHQI
jgi:hypothetical protein